MAQTPVVLIDDQDPELGYLCPSYFERGAESSYNGTFATTEALGNACSNGWWNYSFQGTGIHVAAILLAQAPLYTVKLDDGDFEPQVGGGSYFSPTIPDGKHTITYALPNSGISLPLLDYLAITPGPSTPLLGRTLAVDDTDNSMSFSGSWSTLLPALKTKSPSLYRATAHWSSTVGDSLQFTFMGSSVSVFGIAANISLGNITTSYNLDGVSSTSGLPQGTIDSAPFVELFRADTESGTHTLTVDITGIQPSQALGIDFITYKASFDSISSLSDPSSAQHHGTLSTGSKIGITLGVLALTAILAGFLLLIRRRYRQPKNTKFRIYDSFETGDKKSTFPMQIGKQTYQL
ncbi:hypothetical protein CVT26_011448 [Gymnopilus dilepis]|uniref:Uncharacterized protein n=1 Tax=Gymnopilus dilepis TaxID=231916 RepID=A0A409W8Q3_9AGAR|nr:hypothetical protein CVT26_011448 [Gymnopilus dilepis]